MESDDAYRMALKTMVKWVKKNMDPFKTRVFFATMSPTHYKSVVTLFNMVGKSKLY